MIDEKHLPVDGHHKHDAAIDVLGGGRVIMTDDQSEIVKRKIDKRVLPILMWSVLFPQLIRS